MKRSVMPSNLFISTMVTCLVYCDKSRERNGDYLELARIYYKELEPVWSKAKMPDDMRKAIQEDMDAMKSMKGQRYQIAGNMSITLGQ